MCVVPATAVRVVLVARPDEYLHYANVYDWLAPCAADRGQQLGACQTKI